MENKQIFGIILLLLSFGSLLFLIFALRTAPRRDNENKVEIISFAVVFFIFISIITQLWVYLEDPEVTMLERVRTIAPVFTASLALLAFLIGYLNYKRKSGVDIRLRYIHFGGIDKESDIPQFISDMHFHNYKDKPEKIFAIYLMDKKNNYLKICDFPENAPILIGAFQTTAIDLSMYCFTKKESNIDLFQPETYKVILSTSNGRYEVQSPVHIWKPESYSQCKRKSL